MADNPRFKKYEAQILALDKNKDGEIDIVELCEVLEELSQVEKSRRILKWAAILLAVFAVLTIAAVVGLVYAVVVLTKDTSVVDGNLVTKKTELPVSTGASVSLGDLKSLYNQTLGSLSDVSSILLPTPTGGRVIHVASIDLVPQTKATIKGLDGEVIEIDASGIHQVNQTTNSRRLLLGENDGDGAAVIGTRSVWGDVANGLGCVASIGAVVGTAGTAAVAAGATAVATCGSFADSVIGK